MGKLLAIVLVIVALVSSCPIVSHMVPLPEDISTHGRAIDDQLYDTMLEAGISFIGAQLVLAYFVWSFTGPRQCVFFIPPCFWERFSPRSTCANGFSCLAAALPSAPACLARPSSPSPDSTSFT
jgi:hypothetical protein